MGDGAGAACPIWTKLCNQVFFTDLVQAALASLLFAAAMAAVEVTALATGVAYDRAGPRILLVLPVMVAAVPVLAFRTGLVPVGSGILRWGAATGVQSSTVNALVADLVPRHRRATAYGLFAAVQGAGALVGGPHGRRLLSAIPQRADRAVAFSQTVALLLLLRLNTAARPPGDETYRAAPTAAHAPKSCGPAPS